jgi:predicted SprT family Zn-dependent metalloprotease
MPAKHDRFIEMSRAHLASLAGAWKHARVSRLEIAVNPNLKSTVARWIPPSNVLEISAAAKSRGARALRDIISHEAAHVVVWDRSGRGVRPHGPEWAAVMRAAGFEPRATLVRCGYRRGTSDTVRIRHFCTVCHFSKLARRRIPRWRCPECRAIGLEGKLKTERVSRR